MKRAMKLPSFCALLALSAATAGSAVAPRDLLPAVVLPDSPTAVERSAAKELADGLGAQC